MATTMKTLASDMTKEEGLKHEMTVGDAREFLGKLSDRMYSEPEVAALLIKNGASRAKRKKKK